MVLIHCRVCSRIVRNVPCSLEIRTRKFEKSQKITNKEINKIEERRLITRNLDEDVPDAGPAPVLERHPLHLIRRR